MKKKIIIFEGESLLVKPDLCAFYKEFVKAIPIEAENSEDLFRYQVECIVWGAFYLESAINYTLRMIVEDGVQGILEPRQIWDLLERTRTVKKLDLILDTLTQDDEFKKLRMKQAEKLFGLRNRLAHSNERPEEVEMDVGSVDTEASGIEEVRAKIDAANDAVPNLVKQVMSDSLKKRRQVIIELGEWIENAIFKYYEEKKSGA